MVTDVGDGSEQRGMWECLKGGSADGQGLSLILRGALKWAGASASNSCNASAERGISPSRRSLKRIRSAARSKNPAAAVKISRNVSLPPTRPAYIAGDLARSFGSL